ncbi:MAG: AI-2E family transporter, partial [Halopseudomonas sp.]
MTDSQRWLVLCLSLIIIGLFYLLAPILFPFLTGILLAYMGDPLADRLERTGLSRTGSVVIVFSSLTIALVLVLLLLLPQLGHQIKNLVNQIPLLFDWLKQVAIPWLEQVSGQDMSTLEIDRLRQMVMEHWRSGGDLVTQVLGQASRSGLAFIGWLVNLTL